MSDSIFQKILNPSPSIIGFMAGLNRQLSFNIANFESEQYGTLSAAQRSGKPFIVGIIPPDNTVNFVPFDAKRKDMWDLKSQSNAPVSESAIKQAVAKASNDLPFTKEQIQQRVADGTMGPANAPIVNTKRKINGEALSTLESTGFYDALLTVAKRNNLKPEDVLVIFCGESKLGSNASNSEARGIFQMLKSEITKIAPGTADSFEKMSAVEQLTYYDAYVNNLKPFTGGKNLGALELYLMNAGKVGLINNTNNNGTKVVDDKNYEINKPLDHNGNGVIDMEDMKTHIDKIRREPAYQLAMSALASHIANETTTEPTGLTGIRGEEKRTLMAYGGVTQQEGDDASWRTGSRVSKASAQRIEEVQKQTMALQNQIDILKNMPPLLLLINPSEFSRSYEHTADSGVKGRYGNIVSLWLERPMKISSSGMSAGQYAMDVGGYGGLTTENRVHSLSYQNLMSLFMIYKNNGVIYAGDESQAGIPIVTCSIYIYYDNHIYIGSFSDFSIDDDASKPFNIKYSFTFDVRYDMDIDSSLLIETKISR